MPMPIYEAQTAIETANRVRLRNIKKTPKKEKKAPSPSSMRKLLFLFLPGLLAAIAVGSFDVNWHTMRMYHP